jgi:tetratricopeptide (TPR) repeat protein
MENIRYDRNITLEKYLFGVISQRQYYRYKRGETEVPFDVILKFANKLEITLIKLISSFHEEAAKQKEVIRKYINLILNNQIKEAKKLIKEKGKYIEIDDEIEFFYNVAQLFLEYRLNFLNIDDVIQKLKVNVHYDKIMNNESLHDNEIYVLGLIMEHSEKDRDDILYKINQLRINKKLLLSGNVLFNAQVYFWIIKNLGRQEKYHDVIEIAQEAIKYNKENYSTYANEYFYYYLALAYYRTNNQEAFEEALKNVILYVLRLEGRKKNHFIEMIKKDTGIDYLDFLINKLGEEK